MNRRSFAKNVVKTAGGLYLASMAVPQLLNKKAYAFTDSSATLAARANSQAIVAANGQFNGVIPTGASITTLATTINQYLSAAMADGTIDASNKILKPLAPTLMNNDGAHSTALHNSLNAHAWLGQDSDAVTMMNACTTDERSSTCTSLANNGITPQLQWAVASLNTLGSTMAQLRRPGQGHLVAAAYHPRLLRVSGSSACSTFEGGFLAIAAIGAVAALGGVDPLGDLLTAIGAVGAFVTFVSCQ